MRRGLGHLSRVCFPRHDVVFTTLADRVKFPARGLFGGRSRAMRALFADRGALDDRASVERHGRGSSRRGSPN